MSNKICKAILNVGYHEYVLDLRDAVTIAELLSEAEIHKSEYKEGKTFSRIEPQDNTSNTRVTLRLLGNTEYKMLKLAGDQQS